MMHLGQIAVAAAICLLACGNCRAEGPADSFSSCRQALADIHAGCDLHAEGPRPDLADLNAFPQLKKLKLIGPSERDIKSLAGLASLRELELKRADQRECRYADDALASLAGLAELRAFKSDWRLLADDGLAALRSFQQLQRLDVMIGPKTTAAGIENIRDLKRLQSLCLRVPSELDDLRPRLFEIVGELSALEDLEIVGTIADADLMQLAAVKTLRRLILTHSRGYSDGALAAIVRALPNLQEVQRWYSR